MTLKRWSKYISPGFTKRSGLRILITAVVVYLLFAYVFIPVRLQGHSMEPTYANGSINLCWRQAFLFSEIQRFDVVFVKFAGNRYMLMKRVIALPGETIEFKKGRLFIDGELLDEPHVNSAFDWDLPPRKVKPHHVYVVGDNRAVAMDRHDFGQTAVIRISGAPLW